MYGAGNKNLTFYFAVSYLIKSIQLEYRYPKRARFLSFQNLELLFENYPINVRFFRGRLSLNLKNYSMELSLK